MKCEKCGGKIKSTMKHCPHCGEAIEVSETEKPQINVDFKKYIPYMGIAVIAILIIFLMKSCFFGGTKLKIMDYVQYKYTGLNGDGNVEIIVDEDAAIKWIVSQETLTEREKEELYDILYDVEKDFSLSKIEGLSNGDKIKVKSNLSAKLLKKYGVTIVNDSTKIKVEGIADSCEIPIEEYIKVEYYGFDADGKASVYLDRSSLNQKGEEQLNAIGLYTYDVDAQYRLYDYLDSIKIEPTSFENVNNGDELEVTIEIPEAENQEFGLRLTGEKKKITVDGIAETLSIDLEKYATVAFQGYDGAGYVELSWDEEAFTKEMKDLLEEHGRGLYGAVNEYTDLEDEASDLCSIIINNTSNSFITGSKSDGKISNGDTVEFFCENNTDNPSDLSEYGIVLNGFKKEVKAEGLKEPEEVDISDAVIVEFSGVCPKLRINVQENYESPYYYYCKLDELDVPEYIQVNNGETYSFDIPYDEQKMLEAGYKVVGNTVSRTIENQDSIYGFFESMDEEGIEFLRTYVEKNALNSLFYDVDNCKSLAGYQDGWILPETVTAQMKSVETIQSAENADTLLAVLVSVQFGIKDFKHQVTNKELLYGFTFQNLCISADGVVDFENCWYNSKFYVSEEEFENYIADSFSYIIEGSERENKIEADLEAETESEVELPLDQEIGEAAAIENIASGSFDANAVGNVSNQIVYKGHTYALCETVATWDMAKQLCERAGGHLATVTSPEEQAVIKTLCKDYNSDFWLGATDHDWEGYWVWITGEPFEWTNWRDGQPDNYDDGEECLTTYYNGDSWNDDSMECEYGFILEVEPADSSDSTYVNLIDHQYKEEHNVWMESYIKDSYGNDRYYNLCLSGYDNGYVKYDLDGQYLSLSGILTSGEEANSEGYGNLAVWGDGELLFSRYGYMRKDEPVKFVLDLTGIHSLKIQNSGSENLYLTELELIPNEEIEENTGKPVYTFEDLSLMSQYGLGDIGNESYKTDINGSLCSTRYSLNITESGMASWYLNGDYTSLSMDLFTNWKAYDENNAAFVEILVDGESVYKNEKLSVRDGIEKVELDLTDKNVLEIHTAPVNGDSWDQMLYLANVMISKEREEKTESVLASVEYVDVPEMISERAVASAEYGNSRYYIFDSVCAWSMAHQLCIEAGGHLASIHNESENEFLRNLIDNYGNNDSYWIGGSCQMSNWTWDDQSTMDYSNWSDSDYALRGDFVGYAALRGYDGYWDIGGVDWVTGFIMEVPATKSRAASQINISDITWNETSSAGHTLVRTENNILHDGIYMNARNQDQIEIMLNGEYTDLEGFLKADIGIQMNQSINFAIFGDGILLYEGQNLNKANDILAVSADLTGVNHLVIKTNGNTWDKDAYLYLFDTYLSKAKEAAPIEYAGVDELISVDSVGCESSQSLMEDVYGNLHNGFIKFYENDSSILFNTNQKYSSMKGNITFVNDLMLDQKVSISIWADQELVFEKKDFCKKDGKIPFEIDITDKAVLEIRVNGDIVDGSGVYLTEIQEVINMEKN